LSSYFQVGQQDNDDAYEDLNSPAAFAFAKASSVKKGERDVKRRRAMQKGPKKASAVTEDSSEGHESSEDEKPTKKAAITKKEKPKKAAAKLEESSDAEQSSEDEASCRGGQAEPSESEEESAAEDNRVALENGEDEGDDPTIAATADDNGSEDAENTSGKHSLSHHNASAVVQALPVMPAKQQVVDGWKPGDKSLLLTGVEGEAIIFLSPWETFHVVGSVRVLVLAGSCTIFGAKISAGTATSTAQGGSTGGGSAAASGGIFNDVHAVAPYGPMGECPHLSHFFLSVNTSDISTKFACIAGVDAGGKSIDKSSLNREAMRLHSIGGRDATSAQRRVLDEMLAELTAQRPHALGCVLCLRSWHLPAHVMPHHSKPPAAGGPMQWLKGRGMDSTIRLTLGGARILFPWSACLLQPLKVSGEWQAAADRVLSLSAPAAVAAVVGAKGSGKSMLTRCFDTAAARARKLANLSYC
jgi:hypothetical protein